MGCALNHCRSFRTAALLACALMGTLACVAPSQARAEDASPQLAEPSDAERAAPPEAKDHYERGREHFRAGRYGEAIVELKAALDIDPSSANLLYNIAYTSELLGKLDDAIDYYERYLDALPASAAAEREKTQVTLQRLRGRQSEKAAEAPAPSPAAASEGSFGRADVWFWASLGGGVALLGSGAVTGMLALKRQDDAADFVVGKDGGLKQHKSLVDQSNTLALASDLMFAGGGALIVGAALLYFLRAPDDADSDPEQAATARAGFATDGKSAVLTLHGAF
jgi:tetratricopeptide (TPR) repeat protein